MKAIRRAIVTLAVAAMGALAIAPAAQAGDGLCASGHMCIYVDLSYDGTMRGFSNNRLSWEGYALNNTATSTSANGGTCSRSYYWDAGNWSGDYFYLNSRTLVGSNYRDPDLRNGAGVGTWSAGHNADDKISSANFSSCA